MKFLLHYNDRSHRSEPHSRIEDWLLNLPSKGIREMCSWERFCTFARSPEQRKVGIDARLSVEGVFYEVEPDLAGELVTLWWGLFDNELYVEHREKRYGPYLPIGSPIPLHRYRHLKKTRTQRRADRIEVLAKQLALSKSRAVEVVATEVKEGKIIEFPRLAFVDPDPFQEFFFPTLIAAKRAISDALARPLAKLTAEEMAYVDEVLAKTLNKQEVMAQIREYFNLPSGRP